MTLRHPRVLATLVLVVGDSLMPVGEIACPAVNSCVGIGLADQGSYHTPVYTSAGS